MKSELSRKALFATLAATVVTGLMISGRAAAEELSPWMIRARLLDVVTERNNSAGGGVGADTLKVSDQVQPEIDVTYFFTKNIAAELIATYPVSHSINVSGSDIGGLKELPPTLNLQYHFDPLGQLIPYVGAGVTYMRTWDSRAAGGALTTSQSNWGGDLQIGMDYTIDKHWSFNVDVKKIWISADVQTVGGSKVLTANVNPLLAGVGVGYRF